MSDLEFDNSAFDTNEVEVSEKKGGLSFTDIMIIIIVVLVFIFLWMVPGITAIICVGRTGGYWSQFFGLLIAMLTGPFYWIYFLLHKNYCKSRNSMKQQQPQFSTYKQ